MGGGSEQPSTTTQTSEPWAEQKPYLTKGFSQAENLFLDQTPEYYQGSTVVPFSQQTLLAQQLQQQRALQGNQAQNVGQNQLVNTIGGGYLPDPSTLNQSFQDYYDPSGYNRLFDDSQLQQTFKDYYDPNQFQQAVKAASAEVLPGIQSTYSQAGRTGSYSSDYAQNKAVADIAAQKYLEDYNSQLGAFQEQQQRQMQDLSNQQAERGLQANLYGQNQGNLYGLYGAERERQLNAANLAPTYAANDYTDIGKLGEVGTQQEAMAQQQLQSDIDKWNYDQTIKQQQLANYMNLIGGNYGGTTTQTGQAYGAQSNPFMTGLGGLLSLFSMF